MEANRQGRRGTKLESAKICGGGVGVFDEILCFSTMQEKHK